MERVIKYLDIAKSKLPSRAEAIAINPRAVKHYDLSNARSISKINTFIVLPSNTDPDPDSIIAGRLIFQYNVSISENFHIVDTIKTSIKLSSGFLCVRYRVGSTVHRYYLWGEEQLKTASLGNGGYRNCSDYPRYNGEIIGKNCVFEYFRMSKNPAPAVVRIKGIPELLIKTSLLINPAYAEQTSIIQGVPILHNRTSLGFNLPQNFPVTQDNIAFLDNVI